MNDGNKVSGVVWCNYGIVSSDRFGTAADSRVLPQHVRQKGKHRSPGLVIRFAVVN
ncbi:hypothetical protein D3C81_1924670 [compost metagenome]